MVVIISSSTSTSQHFSIDRHFKNSMAEEPHQQVTEHWAGGMSNHCPWIELSAIHGFSDIDGHVSGQVLLCYTVSSHQMTAGT
jgi:hypothetical protein